jgi:tRNA threonylcarbamoyladenosine modification (KEOPS) complex  Pcc1 subunit
MIRVKIVLKYGDEWTAESLYLTCLKEVVSEPRSGVRARVDGNRLLVLFKSTSPSKMAERIRRILGLLNMAEQAALLLESNHRL